MSGFPQAMKRKLTHHRPVALAALIATTALTFNPASAQETVAPPVVQATPPAAEPAPAPTPPASTAAPVFGPRQAVVQPTPPRPAPVPEVAAPEPAAAPARATRSERAKARAARPVTRSAPERVIPVAAAPVPATPAAPVENITPAPLPTPADQPPADQSIAAEPETADTIAPATDTAETAQPASMMWLWGVLGLGVIAMLIVLFISRRRRDPYALDYGAPTYVAVDDSGAPMPEVNLNERPWIRLMLQPTRTASNGNRQTVEYQVIVENEGHVPAHDVRISSFPAGTKASDIVSGLANVTAQTHHLDIAAGGSVPVNGTVTVPQGTDPRLVIDARYPLPDGREGHLAARFGIDISSDDLEARVEDVLERV